MSNRDESFDVKGARLNEPSGWITLTRYESVRLMVDALIESPPGYRFNKSELARRAGVSRESVREHIDLLLDLGLIEEMNGDQWAEYRLNDSGKVTKELIELNSATNSVLAGEKKDVQNKPTLDDVAEALNYPDSDTETFEDIGIHIDNSRRENDNSLFESPNRVSMVNAD